jgi:tetratricopeptide (TPR) repeat protein
MTAWRAILLAWAPVVLAGPVLLVGSETTAFAQFRPGHIGGVIKSDAGDPIRGAVILAQNKDATPPSLSAVSDEKGRFGLLGLRSGVWSVLVTARGFEPAVLAWPVRSQYAGPSLEVVMVSIPGGVPVMRFDKVKASSVVEDLGKAASHIEAGRTDDAVTIYRALLVKAPSLTSLHLAIGRAFRGGKQPQRAAEAYRALLAVEPANHRARLELGLSLEDAGEVDAAATEFERLVKEAPDSTAAAAARARLQPRSASPDRL